MMRPTQPRQLVCRRDCLLLEAAAFFYPVETRRAEAGAFSSAAKKLARAAASCERSVTRATDITHAVGPLRPSARGFKMKLSLG